MRTGICSLVLAALCSSAVSAQEVIPTKVTVLNFTVSRNGHTVGTEDITVNRSGSNTLVGIKFQIQVKVLGVTLYRFEQTASEKWTSGRLDEMKSDAIDNGKQHKLAFTRHDTVFEADIDGKHSEVDGNILPARFWSEPLYKSARVANAIDGHLMAVSVHDLGNDTVTVHGMPVSAHHYSISGDLVEDLWFTSDGLLTQVKLKASDKSDLSFSIQ